MREERAMQVCIQAESDAMAGQVEQLLDYYRTGLAFDLHRIDLSVRAREDPFGRRFLHCQIHAVPFSGPALSIDESQADLERVVTRALDRCSRTLRRRHQRQRLRRSA